MSIDQMPHVVWVAVGALLVVLGLSFVYKAYDAAVLGRVYYWSGFLPISLISPWFVHLPPGRNSPIKTKEGLLGHALVGPLFFCTALAFLVAGTDLLGWNGSKFVNNLLSHGDKSQPPAISYSPPLHYSFPLLAHSMIKINSHFQSQIGQEPNKRLLPATHGLQRAATDR